MNLPIVLKDTIYKSRHVIRTIIPEKIIKLYFPSVRDSKLELSFSNKYKTHLSTYDYRIYDFWNSYQKEPQLVLSFANKLIERFDFQDFDHIHKLYYTQQDQNIRAAIFLLMNRCGNHLDFFKDSFNLKNATEFRSLMESIAFVPTLPVLYENPFSHFRKSRSFIIFDMPRAFYKNKISVVGDTSFSQQQLFDTLARNTNWCLMTAANDKTKSAMNTFDYYHIDINGQRSLTETNKILFYKT